MYTSVFKLILWRECKIAIKRKGELAITGLFFIVVASLFPLSNVIGNASTYASMAPGIIWIAALLAIMLSLERQFSMDYQLGILEQFAISYYPLPLLAFGKICAQTLIIGLPLIVLIPLLCLLLNISFSDLGIIMLTLVISLPALSAIGAIAAVLIVGLPNGGILMTSILLPIYMPILILATSSIANFQQDLPYIGQLAMLAALSLGSMILSPFALAYGVRLSIK